LSSCRCETSWDHLSLTDSGAISPFSVVKNRITPSFDPEAMYRLVPDALGTAVQVQRETEGWVIVCSKSVTEISTAPLRPTRPHPQCPVFSR
jgi:hypothetical protein